MAYNNSLDMTYQPKKVNNQKVISSIDNIPSKDFLIRKDTPSLDF